MPVGVEFLGRPFSEPDLLKLAYAFEQATHHRRPPSLTPALKP
jgi:Asp-tRNA(Asn)/Glu-tRNA(Gln) amidotransferase A subunit family amidase